MHHLRDEKIASGCSRLRSSEWMHRLINLVDSDHRWRDSVIRMWSLRSVGTSQSYERDPLHKGEHRSPMRYRRGFKSCTNLDMTIVIGAGC